MVPVIAIFAVVFLIYVALKALKFAFSIADMAKGDIAAQVEQFNQFEQRVARLGS
jgi:cell division protein FtsL